MAIKPDPKVEERFLKKLGLKKTPKGKEIDHKKPLVDGGSDTVRNMQLLTIKQHEAKTAREAEARAKRRSSGESGCSHLPQCPNSAPRLAPSS